MIEVAAQPPSQQPRSPALELLADAAWQDFSTTRIITTRKACRTIQLVAKFSFHRTTSTLQPRRAARARRASRAALAGGKRRAVAMPVGMALQQLRGGDDVIVAQGAAHELHADRQARGAEAGGNADRGQAA